MQHAISVGHHLTRDLIGPQQSHFTQQRFRIQIHRSGDCVGDFLRVGVEKHWVRDDALCKTTVRKRVAVEIHNRAPQRWNQVNVAGLLGSRGGQFIVPNGDPTNLRIQQP